MATDVDNWRGEDAFWNSYREYAAMPRISFRFFIGVLLLCLVVFQGASVTMQFLDYRRGHIARERHEAEERYAEKLRYQFGNP